MKELLLNELKEIQEEFKKIKNEIFVYKISLNELVNNEFLKYETTSGKFDFDFNNLIISIEKETQKMRESHISLLKLREKLKCLRKCLFNLRDEGILNVEDERFIEGEVEKLLDEIFYITKEGYKDFGGNLNG